MEVEKRAASFKEEEVNFIVDKEHPVAISSKMRCEEASEGELDVLCGAIVTLIEVGCMEIGLVDGVDGEGAAGSWWEKP